MSVSDLRGAAPRLSEGLQFLGEYQGSGYARAPMLVRRADGQVLQLSPLLYTLAHCVDGETPVEDLARRVSAEAGRTLTSDGVDYLLAEKLRPLGLLVSDSGPVGPPRARPLLAIRARQRFIPEPAVNRLAAVLAQLFRWPAVALMLIGVALVDYAVLIRDGVGPSLNAMALTPAFLLAVLALVLISIVIHEFGHAAGCRYGGGRPGAIGIGIYLVWPVFYTNVNDAYRLSKAGRLRTDLGGGYFSLISVVAFGAAYAVSSWPPFAIAIAAIQLQLVQQLLPIVRFDGYYVLSDLVGIPDLFSRIGPILRNLARRRPRDPRVRDLRPRIRVIVTAWVLTVVPLLALSFGLLLIQLPTYLRDSWATLEAHLATSAEAVGQADAVAVAVGIVNVTAVVIPIVGITLVVGRLARLAGHRLGPAPSIALSAALALGIVALVATGTLPLADRDSDASGRPAPRPTVDRFDADAAWRLVEQEVALGPRPAGSPAARQLADRLRQLLPGGRYQPLPDGLRNIIAVVPGRQPERLAVIGAHYDTKDLPGFVGANDGASGTAIVTQIARSLRPRQLRPTMAFMLFDGEESPRGTPDYTFAQKGLRGSRVAARQFRHAEAMVLLDFVGDRRLRIPREQLSDPGLWDRLRAAADRVGTGAVFPDAPQPAVLDDHIPFRQAGVPAIDLIDLDFPCYHRRCDNLSAVAPRSLDAVGETTVELLRSL